MGTGTMRLNQMRKCPAAACGFEVNPYIISATKVNSGSIDYALECPVCGQSWAEVHQQKYPDPGD